MDARGGSEIRFVVSDLRLPIAVPATSKRSSAVAMQWRICSSNDGVAPPVREPVTSVLHNLPHSCLEGGAVPSASRSAGSDPVSSIISSGALELGIVRTFGGNRKSKAPLQALAILFKEGDDGDRLTVIGESPDRPRINNLFAVSSLFGDRGGCVAHLSVHPTSQHLVRGEAVCRVSTKQNESGFQICSVDCPLQPRIPLKISARKIRLLHKKKARDVNMM